VRDAGVVYQNIDPPVRAVEAAEDARDLERVGHVATGGVGTATSIANPCHDLLRGGLVHVEDDDMGPLPGKQRCDGSAYAGPGTGDDGNLPRQIEHAPA